MVDRRVRSTGRPPLEIRQSPRRTGRPRAEDLEALEARLILEASQLFFRYGYGATTMSDVAAAACVSKNTLYARFSTKADLFRAIVAEQLELWDNGPDLVSLDQVKTLGEALLRFGDIVLRASGVGDVRQVYRLLHSESERFPELAEIAAARFQRGLDFLAMLVRQTSAFERIPCRDPEKVAELFLTMVAGCANLAIVNNRLMEAEERQAWLEGAIRIFLGDRSTF